MRWFEQQRQNWIRETLRVFGFIQRKHLMRKFGISEMQASVDLQRFLRANPDAMVYDKVKKRYVCGHGGIAKLLMKNLSSRKKPR